MIEEPCFKDDPLVTIDDIRRRHCVAGARRWFAARGLDFRDAVRNGVPSSVLLATGDAFAEQVVEDVRRRKESSDGR